MVSHSGSEKVIGVLVAGVNPRHELDDTARYVRGWSQDDPALHKPLSLAFTLPSTTGYSST
jgi:hypothetical protein